MTKTKSGTVKKRSTSNRKTLSRNNTKPVIIHIIGLSGSGKTTLGQRLAVLPNTLVVDTDDIDDPNSLKVIEKYKFESEKDIDLMRTEVGKLNKTQLTTLINKNKTKTLIFVGFPHAGMEQIEKRITHGFAIDISPIKVWEQYNSRTSKIIGQHQNEIIQMLKNPDLTGLKKHILLSHKYGIRSGFDCIYDEYLEKKLTSMKKNARNNGYTIQNADQIFESIKKLVSTVES